MARRDIIVIGGSTGSLSSLRTILPALPADFPAAILVVLHMSPSSPGIVTSLLERVTPLRVRKATHGEEIKSGNVYVAPPDFHLIVNESTIELSHKARINNFRPAIDPLFLTASKAFDGRVIGILLSGGMDDGTRGLEYIKSRGGLTIVQDPETAEAPDLPRSAIHRVAVDHIAAPSAIPSILLDVVGSSVAVKGAKASDDSDREEKIFQEPASGLTCPSCGGAIWERRHNDDVLFQCHVGHGFSEAAFLHAQVDSVEEALWAALRALKEQMELRRKMAKRAQERGLAHLFADLQQQIAELEERAEQLRRVILNPFGEATSA